MGRDHAQLIADVGAGTEPRRLKHVLNKFVRAELDQSQVEGSVERQWARMWRHEMAATHETARLPVYAYSQPGVHSLWTSRNFHLYGGLGKKVRKSDAEVKSSAVPPQKAEAEHNEVGFSRMTLQRKHKLQPKLQYDKLSRSWNSLPQSGSRSPRVQQMHRDMLHQFEEGVDAGDIIQVAAFSPLSPLGVRRRAYSPPSCPPGQHNVTPSRRDGRNAIVPYTPPRSWHVSSPASSPEASSAAASVSCGHSWADTHKIPNALNAILLLFLICLYLTLYLYLVV